MVCASLLHLAESVGLGATMVIALGVGAAASAFAKAIMRALAAMI